ncbi:hypothetical protein [Caldibacillus thermoamylovorans]|uniref:hypothetical protein n=1 Tax=Caldibacillus thermoamylovorans TaxID=35841 RepID=UPI001260188E|nr:hypothetical protein [Caldibacillus thermoamylovorans]
MRLETLYCDDEPCSRHQFAVENLIFWRRGHFSSSFFGRKLHFLATSPFLVVIFWPETPFFGDETQSHHHFEVKTAQF